MNDTEIIAAYRDVAMRLNKLAIALPKDSYAQRRCGHDADHYDLEAAHAEDRANRG